LDTAKQRPLTISSRGYGKGKTNTQWYRQAAVITIVATQPRDNQAVSTKDDASV